MSGSLYKLSVLFPARAEMVTREQTGLIRWNLDLRCLVQSGSHRASVAHPSLAACWSCIHKFLHVEMLWLVKRCEFKESRAVQTMRAIWYHRTCGSTCEVDGHIPHSAGLWDVWLLSPWSKTQLFKPVVCTLLSRVQFLVMTGPKHWCLSLLIPTGNMSTLGVKKHGPANHKRNWNANFQFHWASPARYAFPTCLI